MKEEKILKNLSAFAGNEEAGLKQVRLYKRISKFGGWLILLIAFSLAFMEPALLPVWLVVFVAAMGGAMIGLDIWFEHTLDSWPVIRRYLDLERLQAEAGKPPNGDNKQE